MRKLVPFFLTGAMTLAFLIGGSVRSEASLIAYLCNDANCSGGGDIIVTDGGAGDVAAGIPGEVQISNAGTGIPYNGWEVYVDTSESKPLLGSTTLPQMDINYGFTNTAGTSAGTVWLYVSDTDFTGLVDTTAQLGGTSSISPFFVNAGIFGGTSNTNLDLSNLVCAMGGFTTSPYSGSCTGGPVGLISPYSLTLGMVIAPGGVGNAAFTGGSITGDLSLTSTAVPEPATLFMLGTGLVGAATRLRRRRSA